MKVLFLRERTQKGSFYNDGSAAEHDRRNPGNYRWSPTYGLIFSLYDGQKQWAFSGNHTLNFERGSFPGLQPA